MPKWILSFLIAVVALWVGVAVGRSGAKGFERERARKSVDVARALMGKTYTLVPSGGMVFYHDGKTRTSELRIDLFGNGGGDSDHFEAANFRQFGMVDVTALKTTGNWSKPAEVVKNFLGQIQSQDGEWRGADFWRSSAEAWHPNTHERLDTGSIGVIRRDHGVITIVAYPSQFTPNFVVVAMSSRLSDRLPARE